MRNVFGKGVLGADGRDAGFGGLAGFGEGVVAGIEVFAFLEFVLEEILFVGQFSVEAEELLLFFGHGADVHFVLLVGIHGL